MGNIGQENMVEFVASLHLEGPGLDIRVGDTTFENVLDVPVAEQVSFLISGDAGIDLDDRVFINEDLAERVINILNGEDSE